MIFKPKDCSDKSIKSRKTTDRVCTAGGDVSAAVSSASSLVFDSILDCLVEVEDGTSQIWYRLDCWVCLCAERFGPLWLAWVFEVFISATYITLSTKLHYFAQIIFSDFEGNFISKNCSLSIGRRNSITLAKILLLKPLTSPYFTWGYISTLLLLLSEETAAFRGKCERDVC